jgi:Uma2 family endonuclease
MVTFEIISHSSEKKDRETKHDLYYAAGVKFYVIVFPEDEMVEVYEWSENGYILKLQGHSGIYDFDFNICKMTIDFQTIWN